MPQRIWATAAIMFALWLSPPAAHGVVKNILPLNRVLATQPLIFVAKVDKVLPDKPAMMVTAGAVLKGKVPFTRMPVNLSGDAAGKRDKDPEEILKRMAAGLEIVFFVSKRGETYEAFGFTNGTWFHMIGEGDKPEDVTWLFTNCERYLRRTFKGTTEELKKVVADGLSGKKAPPPADEKEPPGLGPEIKSDDKPKDPPLTKGGPASLPFAVVPTFVLIGPLAILAALFPTVFGGLAIMMKRWTAALSISSLVSTVYFLQMWFYGRLTGTWLATPTGLWTTLAVISALGAVWAGVRYRKAIRDADFETYQPRKWDYLVLIVMSVVCLGIIFYLIETKKNLLQAPYLDLLASCVPVWVATAALLFVRSGPEGTSAFSLESAFLWGLVFACANVVALEHGRAGGTGVQVIADTGARVPRPVGTAWVFEPIGNGTTYTTPLVAGDRMYIPAIQYQGLTQIGVLYCIDANTSKEVWRFDNKEQMKAAFSAAVLVDGKIFIGEGNHQDQNCRLFCLDANTGKEIWSFQTTSHTESTPCVVNGRVYFGAGDDGVFCVGAADGKRIWNYPAVHVDSNPIVHDGRLYVGSGVGDKFQNTLVFCLDAEKGTEIWKLPVDEAAFAPPVFAGAHVYFGIGNGNYDSSGDKPVGALLCIEAATGKRIWRCDVPDAVLGQPAVDSDYVYFTARDGNCYCASRIDGRVKWKQPIGGPAVAGPALVGDEGEFGTVRSLYVATTDGRIACLNPDDGKPFWSRDLTRLAKLPKANVSATPVVISRTEGGVERRRILIAAGVSNETTSLARVYCFEDEVK